MVGDCRRGRCPHRPGDLDASEGGSTSTAWAGVTATAGATSELSRILIDTAVMGNSSEFSLEVKRLRTEGMSAEEAWRQTFTDYVERVVDTGVRSGRYGLIAGLSEYGGEYFRQHPEAFNALVNGKTGWSGGMRGLQPGGAQGLLGLPSTHLTPEGAGAQSMPTPQGPVAVKDDWETAIEEAVAEWKGSGTGRPEPESVDISGENGIIINKGAERAGRLPQGIKEQPFETASQLIRGIVGDISDDIVVQGSRAAGTAKVDSDIDFAIRVSQEQFDNLIKQYFKVPNPGSAAERTLFHAIQSGKIQSGEARLSRLRKMLEKQFGMKVDISIILKGGPFDNGANIVLP
ncbi:hypothetical protein KL86CLO1_11180 [uncultured Eubacteriales bacterium]|uniref:Polymerase nucleotidyl transferase domain-containing protein n=1 Tax=uncultured Eubacteriales bacterium TaxID=172733 RepID=A0A212JIT6_9FIRM|nr:hypothetical protein KL86CLO1_11180 [uncultured Eubacteriales bacterium]